MTEPVSYHAVVAELLACLFNGKVTHLESNNPRGFYFVSRNNIAAQVLFKDMVRHVSQQVKSEYMVEFHQVDNRIECTLTSIYDGRTFKGEYAWQSRNKAKLVAFLHACSLLHQTLATE